MAVNIKILNNLITVHVHSKNKQRNETKKKKWRWTECRKNLSEDMLNYLVGIMFSL